MTDLLAGWSGYVYTEYPFRGDAVYLWRLSEANAMMFMRWATPLKVDQWMDYWGSDDRGEEEMRFSNPLARNPWPHDMAITVEDHPFPLNLLLFIRQAWQLEVDADIPKLLPLPARGNSKAPDSASLPEWGTRWQTAWDRAWTWYQIADSSRPQYPTQESMRQMQETMRQVMQPGQPLHPSIPPLWTADYDWDGIDQDAFNTWDQSLAPKILTDVERQNLSSLIPAWESGMDTIIVLPYAGYFAQRISRRHLAVSASTRNDPESYRQALQTAWAG